MRQANCHTARWRTWLRRCALANLSAWQHYERIKNCTYLANEARQCYDSVFGFIVSPRKWMIFVLRLGHCNTLPLRGWSARICFQNTRYQSNDERRCRWKHFILLWQTKVDFPIGEHMRFFHSFDYSLAVRVNLASVVLINTSVLAGVLSASVHDA